MQPRKLKLPAKVLDRARKVSSEAPRGPGAPPPSPRADKRHPREKIVLALKKLHPMD